MFVIQITASSFVPFHVAIVLCVIRITASPFVPFHCAIVQWPNEKGQMEKLWEAVI
jgi:hypothetical protein